MIRRVVLIIVLAAGLGLGDDWFAPSSGQAQGATTLVSLQIQPGSTDFRLTCGWHVICLPPYGVRQALDWGNFAGQTVYWRSHALRQDPFGGEAATGEVVEMPTGCRRLAIILRDPFGNYIDESYQTHTIRSRYSPFQIMAGSFNNTFTQVATGTTAYEPGDAGNPNLEEFAGCLYAGPHLHQYSSPLFSINTAVYPDAPAPNPPRPYSLTNEQNWVNRRAFQIQIP